MTDDSTRRPYAVVTGASSGIGLELARQFSIHGYDVLMVADDDDVIGAAAALGGAGSVRRARSTCATSTPSNGCGRRSRQRADRSTRSP